MSRQRHRRQLSPADRHTLLRLMSDEHYQQTKLGAAFPPARQRCSGLFWQLVAAYLEQPLLRVMLAGSSLHTEADALWQRQRERHRLHRQHVAAAASLPPPKAAAAAAPTPAAEPERPTPALRGEEAAAGGSSHSGGSKRLRKEKGERRRQRKAAAERSSSGQAQAPARAAEQRPAIKKKRRRQEEKGSSSTLAGLADPPSAAAPRQAAPEAAAAAEGQLPPPKKKRRRQEAGSRHAIATAAVAPWVHAAEAAAPKQQEQPHNLFAGAFVAFRPQAAAEGQQQQGARTVEQAPARGTQCGPHSGAFAAFAAAPAAAPATVPPAAAAPAAAAHPAPALMAGAHPHSAKRRWRSEADAELQQLAGSAEHRQQVLGSAELDWETIGRHFGRTACAVQAHYRQLSRAASSVQAAAGSAAAAAESEHTACDEEAGQSAGSSSGAAGPAQPVRAAITIGLPPPAGQQHESPPFVGIHHKPNSRLPWVSQANIQSEQWHLASCASRAAAAAGHDVARIWCSSHGKEARRTCTNINFPQLLEDDGLEQQLQAVPDVPALRDFLATWLAQQWPQLEAAMLAGRAAALNRYIAATSRRLGIWRHGQGWRAAITAAGQRFTLGTWPTETEAGVVRDVGSVWRGLHTSSTKASQLYNNPQLRLWQDAALVASLRGIQSGEQLQVFVKAWAEQHLPAMLDRLA